MGTGYRRPFNFMVRILRLAFRRFTIRCSRLAIVVLATGCGYWGRRPLNQPAPVERHSPVWIWSGGEVNKWHAVVITQDSVSGIPYQMSVWCDSCRRRMPRAQVDSMKLGYRTFTEYATQGIGVVTVGLLLEAAVCSLVAPQDGQC